MPKYSREVIESMRLQVGIAARMVDALDRIVQAVDAEAREADNIHAKLDECLMDMEDANTDAYIAQMKAKVAAEEIME